MEEVTVYNIEVDGYHTYFVSELCILVHNKALSRGQKNNVVGTAFENPIDSRIRRSGRVPIYRASPGTGGFDVVSVGKNGDIVIHEAKFANKVQYDDFTAITTNLKDNIQATLDELSSVQNLTRAEKKLVQQSLQNALSGNTSNVKIEVISGKRDLGNDSKASYHKIQVGFKLTLLSYSYELLV